jgi:hypothetical protein
MNAIHSALIFSASTLQFCGNIVLRQAENLLWNCWQQYYLRTDHSSFSCSSPCHWAAGMRGVGLEVGLLLDWCAWKTYLIMCITVLLDNEVYIPTDLLYTHNPEKDTTPISQQARYKSEMSHSSDCVVKYFYFACSDNLEVTQSLRSRHAHRTMSINREVQTIHFDICY